MKSTFSKIVLSALVTVVALSVSTASAQEGKQSGIVAVLDVAKVFKENRDFESKMQSIKSTADQLKASIQQKQEAIPPASWVGVGANARAASAEWGWHPVNVLWRLDGAVAP